MPGSEPHQGPPSSPAEHGPGGAAIVSPRAESQLPSWSLLDEREAATLLRVTPATVRNERVRGKLGFTRVGARIFYTDWQIADYLEQHTVTPCVRQPNSAPARSESIGP